MSVAENLKNNLVKVDLNASSDFDFEIGDWQVKHRRKEVLLEPDSKWIEFEGTSSMRKVLNGMGNVEENVLDFPGSAFHALAIRTYQPDTKQWSIWWLDGRFPDGMDVPVVGKFSNGIGLFFADDVLAGIRVKVRFKWDATNPGLPRWEQAFSTNDGQSWETNWIMDFLPKT